MFIESTGGPPDIYDNKENITQSNVEDRVIDLNQQVFGQ